MYLKIFVFIGCQFFNFSLSCLGQVDTATVYRLPEVKVETPRLQNFIIGSKIQQIDSVLLLSAKNQTLAELLSEQNYIFIKQYSPGLLSSLSFRGTNASQTAVLWNGLNLQSTVNGQLDINLIPAGFLSNASIQFGGDGALYGSGAVGGTIHLHNRPDFGKGLMAKINSATGSFGAKTLGLDLGYSKHKWVVDIKLINSTANNDFDFTDPLLGKRSQTNAMQLRHGVLSGLYFKPSEKKLLSIRYWYQNTYRQIPPLLGIAYNDQYQKDLSHRSSIEWKQLIGTATWYSRSGWFKEGLVFADPSKNAVSVTDAHTIITETEIYVPLKTIHELNIGINNTFASAVSVNFPQNPTQNRLSAFASYKITDHKKIISATASIRHTWVGWQSTLPTPALGIEWMAWKDFLKIKSKAARTYRLPTFNELYWIGYDQGNPNLKPEEGWSCDLGISSMYTLNKTTFTIGITAFTNSVDNLILWKSSNGRWRSQNVQEVWARGIELNGKVKFAIGKCLLTVHGNYDFTFSTVQKSDSKDDPVGKQLMYVPFEKAFANVTWQYKKFTFLYNCAYNGFRYTSTDNTTSTPGFALHNISLAHSFVYKKFALGCFGKINNLANENYQVIPGYIMPGLQWQAGLTLEFNQPLSLKL